MVNITYGNGKTLAFPKFPDVCLLQQINNSRSQQKSLQILTCGMWATCAGFFWHYYRKVTSVLADGYSWQRTFAKFHSIWRMPLTLQGHSNRVSSHEIEMLVSKDHNQQAALRSFANQTAHCYDLCRKASEFHTYQYCVWTMLSQVHDIYQTNPADFKRICLSILCFNTVNQWEIITQSSCREEMEK